LSITDLKIEPGQTRVDNQRVRVYKDIELSPRGRQVLGLDETDDVDQKQVGDAEQATKIVFDELLSMVEQNDNQPVPREGLVWRCAGDITTTAASQAVNRLAESGRLIETCDGILPNQ